MSDANTPRHVVLTGPESSGKTTLCRLLAAEYGTSWVPEQARSYLMATGGRYKEEDLVYIAERQRRVMAVRARRAKDYLFCDTGALVLRIWSEVRYGRVAPALERALAALPVPVAYILCKPDMPWAPDPLREHPDGRAGLFELYLSQLGGMSVPYLIAAGSPAERVGQVQRFLAPLA